MLHAPTEKCIFIKINKSLNVYISLPHSPTRRYFSSSAPRARAYKQRNALVLDFPRIRNVKTNQPKNNLSTSTGWFRIVLNAACRTNAMAPTNVVAFFVRQQTSECLLPDVANNTRFRLQFSPSPTAALELLL